MTRTWQGSGMLFMTFIGSRSEESLTPQPPQRIEQPAGAQGAASLAADEQQQLLTLARRSLATAVARAPVAKLEPGQLPEPLQASGACFVTLTKAGRLRGCIGEIFASRPLFEAVVANARSAALSDTRFTPVEPDELDELAIEISVLTPPERLVYGSPDELLRKLRPRVDGVVLASQGHRATYLPQVWEQIPDPEQFLRELARKAQLAPEAWKDPRVEVLTYQVHHFAAPFRP